MALIAPDRSFERFEPPDRYQNLLRSREAERQLPPQLGSIMSCFPGLGEQHILKSKNTAVSDLHMQEVYMDGYFGLPEWPYNYLDAIRNATKGKNDVVFTEASPDARNALVRDGLLVTLAYPTRDRRDEFKSIEVDEKRWDDMITEVEQTRHCLFLELSAGQKLLDHIGVIRKTEERFRLAKVWDYNISKHLGSIVMSYKGTGKTYLQENRQLAPAEFQEIEEIHDYHYSNLENNAPNPAWPDNYINAIRERLVNEHAVVLLDANPWNVLILFYANIAFSLVYPDIGSKAEYMKVGTARHGDAVHEWMERWEKDIQSFPTVNADYTLSLKEGQHLSDVIADVVQEGNPRAVQVPEKPAPPVDSNGANQAVTDPAGVAETALQPPTDPAPSSFARLRQWFSKKRRPTQEPIDTPAESDPEGDDNDILPCACNCGCPPTDLITWSVATLVIWGGFVALLIAMVFTIWKSLEQRNLWMAANNLTRLRVVDNRVPGAFVEALEEWIRAQRGLEE